VINRPNDCAWFGAGGESISPSPASDKTAIRFDGVVKVGTDCCSRNHTIGERDATGERRHAVSKRLPCQAFCITKHSLRIAVRVRFAVKPKAELLFRCLQQCLYNKTFLGVHGDHYGVQNIPPLLNHLEIDRWMTESCKL